MDDILTFLISIIVAFWLILAYPIGNHYGYQQGKCEGQYGSGAIYEDGECFIPLRK